MALFTACIINAVRTYHANENHSSTTVHEVLPYSFLPLEARREVLYPSVLQI